MKFFKRYSEALLIVGFLLLDSFASGGVLTALAVVALLLVALPAIRDLIGLKEPAARLVYLRAFVKTQKVQRLALICFWLLGFRWLLDAAAQANLIRFSGPLPVSVTNSLVFGIGNFVQIAYLGTPLLLYASACLVSLLLRARLKVSKSDPDLVVARQTWCGFSQAVFSLAFIGSILSITMNPSGPAYMMSNWLLASAKDANLFASPTSTTVVDYGGGWVDVVNAPYLLGPDRNLFADMAFIPVFDAFVIGLLSLGAFAFLLQPAVKLNALLTSFCWRVVSPKSLQNLIEAFLQALHLPKRVVGFREAHPLISNAVRTVAWVVACYVGLWWLFGFCGGPVGYSIQSWMIASAVDAGFGTPAHAPKWMFEPNFRIFMGSVVALYGTAPIAVTASIFLPFARARQIVLDADGLLFLRGPYLSLMGRQFRLWSDLNKVDVEKGKTLARFRIAFRSGGWVTFDERQVSAQDLKVLLDNVDEHASMCEVSPEVFNVVQELLERETERGDSGVTSDGITHSAIAGARPEQFKSTIFSPYAHGDLIPNTGARVIRQLASKPLCAVYLAREQTGRMVIVKQFYLASDSAETQAMARTLQREYELLSRLDHAGIAKVVNSFSEGKSTYLVIEHRLGNDLREVVAEHGPRSESLTISWAKQICEIMIYLHGQDPPILHRDLTPDNVIAGEDGQLRLIDFGAAREFLDGITGTMIGKHCYVPPEQLKGDATTRSDIYSFGATLYFLLTGRDPVALSESSPAMVMECSQELDLLIRDCTAFDQAKRPESFSAVFERLEAMGGGFRLKVPAKKEGAVV